MRERRQQSAVAKVNIKILSGKKGIEQAFGRSTLVLRVLGQEVQNEVNGRTAVIRGFEIAAGNSRYSFVD